MKECSGVGIGIHLCLVGEKAISEVSKVSSIIDDKGYLLADYRNFLFKIWSRKVNFSEVEYELDMQIRTILEYEITPTHLDCHQYIYFIHPVFEIIVKLAKKYNIKCIRYPVRGISNQCPSVSNIIKNLNIFFSSKSRSKELLDNDLYYPDFSYGVTTAGHLNEARLKKFLENICIGHSDITCHPGYVPCDKKYLDWGYEWEKELCLLVDKETKDMINDFGIELINYAP